ncbi:MAG: hypothetical protein WAU07_04535 [Microgenomates group bacterium]
MKSEELQVSRNIKIWPKKIWFLVVFFAFIIGLVFAFAVFNQRHHAKEINLEVTFVTPRQAVVFWKTDHPTIGFIKYGATKNNLDKISYQTSSESGEIHAVVLDDVPLEGLFISVHNESDSAFIWPKVLPITFDPSTIE